MFIHQEATWFSKPQLSFQTGMTITLDQISLFLGENNKPVLTSLWHCPLQDTTRMGSEAQGDDYVNKATAGKSTRTYVRRGSVGRGSETRQKAQVELGDHCREGKIRREGEVGQMPDQRGSDRLETPCNLRDGEALRGEETAAGGCQRRAAV